MCSAVCWWLCVCRIDSTTHRITAVPPAPSRRVINNWPFVPFLPRLFLFSPPLSWPSPSSSPPPPTPPLLFPFFFFYLSTLLPPFPPQYFLLFTLSLALHVFISFLKLPPFFPHFLFSADTLLLPTFLSLFSHSLSPSQVIVETRCPTFTWNCSTSCHPTVANTCVRVSEWLWELLRERKRVREPPLSAANNRYCCLCFYKTYFYVEVSLNLTPMSSGYTLGVFWEAPDPACCFQCCNAPIWASKEQKYFSTCCYVQLFYIYRQH